jgi:predicted TIM-barrel fold metal-dependent hydrolase
LEIKSIFVGSVAAAGGVVTYSARVCMLRSVVGMGQVLFGSDYPYLRRDLAVACRHEVETSTELDAQESRAVLADNALKLFPRLAARAAVIEAEAVTLTQE